MHLLWLRNDLRLTDNSALLAAAECESPVIALYVWSPGQHRLHNTAAIKLHFIYQHLVALSAQLAQRGIALHVIEQSSFWQIPDAVLSFAQQHGVSHLFFNDEYGVHEQARDDRCQQLFMRDGRAVSRFCDRLLIRPGSVLNQQGKLYSVFTPFARAAKAYLDRVPPQIGDIPASKKSVKTPPFSIEPLPNASSISWPIGEHAALKQLKLFCQEKMSDYVEMRDYPAQSGGSRLSPYLAIGVLSPRQVFQAIRQANTAATREGADKFLDELLWREFYSHLMALVPRLSKHQAWQQHTEQLNWLRNEQDFKRWCEARTGIPIVDAAMRELLQTGWMHNRCRMIVASFLSKNLFIDWRWGEQFFMQHLIDGDFASNNGGWQWCASVGVDAAPHFRVFNPVTQSQRFDPEGEYIKHYLPELAHEPTARLHELGARLHYPAPMVDLSASRARAIARFQALQQQKSLLQGELF